MQPPYYCLLPRHLHRTLKAWSLRERLVSVIGIISLYERQHLIALNRLIEPFQKGETPTFIDHIKAGLKALAEDCHSLLVFSGYEVLHNLLLDFFSLIQ